jgi:hypothetical protein
MMTTADLPFLCTYSIGDPFNADDPERACGLRAIKRVDWSSINEAWGHVYYCTRHWTIARQFSQPGVIIIDISTVEDYGPEPE